MGEVRVLHCVTFDAFVTNAAAAASNLRFSWLFPFDGAGGFTGDVVDDTVYTADFADDSARYFGK